MMKRCKTLRPEQDALYWSLLGRFNREKPEEQKLERFKKNKADDNATDGQPPSKKRKPFQVPILDFVIISFSLKFVVEILEQAM